MMISLMAIPITHFKDYCGSPDYHADLAAGFTTKRLASSVVNGAMTPQELRCSVKRYKMHYTSLKDDRHLITWNRRFLATQQQQTILQSFARFKLSCMLFGETLEDQ
jgi:hypothetical protein